MSVWCKNEFSMLCVYSVVNGMEKCPCTVAVHRLKFTSSLLVTVMLKMLTLIRGAGKCKVFFTFSPPTSLKITKNTRNAGTLCLMLRRNCIIYSICRLDVLQQRKRVLFLECSDESIAQLLQTSYFYIPGANLPSCMF